MSAAATPAASRRKSDPKKPARKSAGAAASTSKVTAFAKLVGNNDFMHYITARSVTLGRTVVGGTRKANIMLGRNKHLSRLHAQINYKPELGKFTIAATSKNGIIVDGQLLTPAFGPQVLNSRTLIQV